MATAEPIRGAQLHVFTFKQGMLARLGHDLRLSWTRFSVTLDGARVGAVIDAASVRVDGAVVRGRLDPSAPPPMMHGEIVANVRDAVLLVARHPRIEVTGTWDAGAHRVAGELTLLGRTHGVAVPVVAGGEAVCARVEIAPSRWGVRPFRALGGTLKVQDRVRVELHLPVPGDPPTAATWIGPDGPA